jgi:hypothetical protein
MKEYIQLIEDLQNEITKKNSSIENQIKEIDEKNLKIINYEQIIQN